MLLKYKDKILAMLDKYYIACITKKYDDFSTN